MQLALDGDEAAYRRLLVAISAHVRGVARRWVVRAGNGTGDVEDIVQETLLAVHLKRATWDRSKPFTPWLNAIAKYKAIDVTRRTRRDRAVDIDTVSNEIPAPAGATADTAIDAPRVLAVLDARQRRIVEDITMTGRTAAEVGAQLGLSEGAVRVALHRALKKLAHTFKGGRHED